MKKVKITNRLLALLLAGSITLVGCARIGQKEKAELPTNNNLVETVEETVSDIEVNKKDIVTKEEVNIRTAPNTSSDIIDTVGVNTTLTSINQVDGWYEIIYNDEIAYVSSEYVYDAVNKDGISKEIGNYEISDITIEVIPEVQSTTTLNIRRDATTDSNVIGTLGEGQKLEVNRLLDNGWYEVKYNNELAYVSGDYVIETSEERINAPFKQIVMFNKDSNTYDVHTSEVIEEVPTYEIAYIYQELDNKYLAKVNNKICYINKEDISSLSNKVVIVDISDQNAKLYDGNNIIVDTPVVSGKQSTPSDIGLFDIDWMGTNCTLEGPGYSSFVDFWIPYNGGEGLHDAEFHTDYDSNGNVIRSHGWRNYSDFGGDTYKNNGSHGCINLPHDAAKTIYDNVDYDTNILIKK